MSTTQPNGLPGAPSPIPTVERYDAVARDLSIAIDHLGFIIHDLGNVADEDGDLREGVEPPTLADVGALFAFVDDVTDLADNLRRDTETLRARLVRLNMARHHGVCREAALKDARGV